MNDQRISPDEERIFIEHMLCVDSLYDHIAHNTDGALFFFIPYMFATTYYGIQVCPERSYLIPCFHDEAYARLQIYQRAFRRVKAMLFLSEPERRLAERLFDLSRMRTEVIGVGIDTRYLGDAAAFRQKTGLDGPFILYAGRREQGKNINLLIDYFRRFRAEGRCGVRLVLLGPGSMPMAVKADEGIIDLGYVSVQEKWHAYAAASVLCQPSTHESFSIVMMEAWLAGTPALVHADGAVTADHCRRANGGLYFANYDEFAACLDVLLTRPDMRARLGRQGRDYVLRNFSWDTIVDKYRRLMAEGEQA